MLTNTEVGDFLSIMLTNTEVGDFLSIAQIKSLYTAQKLRKKDTSFYQGL